MALAIPLAGKVINGDQLAQELRAAGVPVLGKPGLYVDPDGVLQIVGASEIHRSAAMAVVAAHVPLAQTQPRKEAAIAADLEVELTAQGLDKKTAKAMARLLAHQEMIAPGSIAAQGYTTPTTEAASLST